MGHNTIAKIKGYSLRSDISRENGDKSRQTKSNKTKLNQKNFKYVIKYHIFCTLSPFCLFLFENQIYLLKLKNKTIQLWTFYSDKLICLNAHHHTIVKSASTLLEVCISIIHATLKDA